MSWDILKIGKYILFETTQRYRMISLNEQDFFVWRGSKRLELSDYGHEAAVILHQGDFFLFIPRNEEALEEGVTYLACQEGDLYRIYMLPQGLPSERNGLVDIVESSEMLTQDRLTI